MNSLMDFFNLLIVNRGMMWSFQRLSRSFWPTSIFLPAPSQKFSVKVVFYVQYALIWPCYLISYHIRYIVITKSVAVWSQNERLSLWKDHIMPLFTINRLKTSKVHYSQYPD